MMRAATPADLELICYHREAMFRDAGQPENVLAQMTIHFREWLLPKLIDQSYFGWITEHAGEPIAGLGMIVIDWPPHPFHPASRLRGYILNVFVDPRHRGKGIARALMQRAQDEGRARGITFVTLHATPAGRRLYENMGWKPTTEMSVAIA
jgi:GNAT superfamily N-acetyltransferase